MKRILYILVLGLLAMGCKESTPVDGDQAINTGGKVAVSMQLNAVAPVQIVTRQGVDNESAINSVHMLVFNPDGSLVMLRKFKKLDQSITRVSFEIMPGTYDFYFVCNVRNKNGTIDQGDTFFDQITSRDQFLSTYVSLTHTVNRDQGFVGYGQMLNRKITTLDQGNVLEDVAIERISAKVTINVFNTTDPALQLNVEEYIVRNVPRYAYVVPQQNDYYTNNPTANDPFFDYSTASNFENVDIEGKSAKQGVFYMNENLRGLRRSVDGTTGDVLSQKEKAKYAPDSASYVEIRATYVDAEHFTHTMRYKLFLGSDNSSDYNVRPNFQYTFNVNIRGVNDVSVDTRVSHEKSFLASLNEPVMDAHYDWRPLIISGTSGATRVDIVKSQSDPTPLDDPWLLVSSRATYTEAFNANDLGSLSQQTVGTGKASYYLYAQENLSSMDRQAVIRVIEVNTPTPSASDWTDPAKRTVVYLPIWQRSIRTIGLFGGKNLTMEATYASELAIEHTEEYSLAFGGDDYPTYGLKWGFDGKKTVSSASDPKDGMWNTKILDDNSATSGVRPPFTYYNNYAGKYCADKNRDQNGNGKIDQEELKWYLPSQAQLMVFWVAGLHVSDNADKVYWSSTWISNYYSWAIDFGRGGSTIDAIQFQSHHILCVRDIESRARKMVGESTPGSGIAVIDCQTMPQAAVTSTPKATTTSGNNNYIGANNWQNLGSTKSNEFLYRKFEVANEDLAPCDWRSAVDNCNQYSNQGTGWRLPTQREMMLIWALRDDVEQVPRMAKFMQTVPGRGYDAEYWTATEQTSEDTGGASSGDKSWFVNFKSGSTLSTRRKSTNTLYVRCVRDVIFN